MAALDMKVATGEKNRQKFVDSNASNWKSEKEKKQKWISRILHRMTTRIDRRIGIYFNVIYSTFKVIYSFMSTIGWKWERRIAFSETLKGQSVE